MNSQELAYYKVKRQNANRGTWSAHFIKLVQMYAIENQTMQGAVVSN